MEYIKKFCQSISFVIATIAPIPYFHEKFALK